MVSRNLFPIYYIMCMRYDIVFRCTLYIILYALYIILLNAIILLCVDWLILQTYRVYYEHNLI